MGSSSLNFAVSVTNDPVNDGWHVYNAASNQFPTKVFRITQNIQFGLTDIIVQQIRVEIIYLFLNVKRY